MDLGDIFLFGRRRDSRSILLILFSIFEEGWVLSFRRYILFFPWLVVISHDRKVAFAEVTVDWALYDGAPAVRAVEGYSSCSYFLIADERIQEV